MNIRKINQHIIDLAHSKYDKEKSDPAKGDYLFTDKVYINFRDSGKRPKWFFSWCRDTAFDRADWKATMNYTPVKVNDPDCTYWPESVTPSEKGEYILGDLVWVKRPLLEELRERDETSKITNRGFKGVQQAFENSTKRVRIQTESGVVEEDAGLKDSDKESLDTLAKKFNI